MSFAEVQQTLLEFVQTNKFDHEKIQTSLQNFVVANEDPRISPNLQTNGRDQSRGIVVLLTYFASKSSICIIKRFY